MQGKCTFAELLSLTRNQMRQSAHPLSSTPTNCPPEPHHNFKHHPTKSSADRLKIPTLLLTIVLFLIQLQSIHGGVETESVMECFVTEELQPNTTVGNVIREYGLDRKYNSTVLGRLRFGFMTLPAGDKQYFSVGETTGVIRTAMRIDREELCPRADFCFVKFDVAVQPIEFFQIIKVRVQIHDINDNAPSFPQPSLSFELSEAADPGASFLIPPADDLDGALNGIILYELIPASSSFELVVRLRGDGTQQVRLALRERVDRETRAEYQLSIIALDGGEPVRSAALLINVKLLDANDNVPQFDSTDYEVRLGEDAREGTEVFTARATDRDTGLNGQVGYFFTKDTLEEHGRTFSIEVDTGVVVTRRGFDYETKNEYLLYIVASDRGVGEALSAQTLLVVRIDDVNDKPPIIRINPSLSHRAHPPSEGIPPRQGTPRDPEVLEESEPGTFVAHVSVEDMDSGDNGKFRCFIDDSNLFDLTPLTQSDFKVVTLAKFDRELREHYEFGITCQDGGAPALTSVAAVRVKVLDRNDHSPVFMREVYRAALDENNPIGFSVLRVTATDSDTGVNAQILYRQDDESASKFFDLHPTTGIITARISLDHEAFSVFEFNLTAHDQGDPRRSSQTRVHISVRDLDDEKAEFGVAEYSYAVQENLPPGTQAGTVLAVDRDSAPYNSVIYHIVPPDDDLFSIDETTGRIVTRVLFDREERAVYRITVTATSTLRGRVVTSSATVLIYVADVNDNQPAFEFPNALSNQVMASVLTPKHHIIARARAHDRDVTFNAKLAYRISGGDDLEAFSIDADSGEVRVIRDLSELNADSVKIQLAVSDLGDPPLEQVADLRIVIRKDLPAPRTSKMMSLLASEDLAIVLALTLATIVVAISIVVAIVFLARKRRNAKLRAGLGVGGRGKEEWCASGEVQLKEASCYERYPCAGGTEVQRYGCANVTSLETQALNGGGSQPFQASSSCSYSKPVVGFIRDHLLKKVSPNSDSNSDSGRGPSSEDGDQVSSKQTHPAAEHASRATARQDGEGDWMTGQREQLQNVRHQQKHDGTPVLINGDCSLGDLPAMASGSSHHYHPHAPPNIAPNFQSLTDIRCRRIDLTAEPCGLSPTRTPPFSSHTLDHRRDPGSHKSFHTFRQHPRSAAGASRLYSTLAPPRYSVIREREPSPLSVPLRVKLDCGDDGDEGAEESLIPPLLRENRQAARFREMQ